VAWTPQELIVPAAVRWLKGPAPGGAGGRIVSLLKPHYELAKMTGDKPRGRLSDAEAGDVCREVCRRLDGLSCPVRAAMKSQVRGKGGNLEFLLLLGG
jgi:predicted rRNA methylase YqxC with S4 and FtsJ domains